ncbi:MAG: helix-turn-helix domain-containing protein [Actinomycetota bacterium]
MSRSRQQEPSERLALSVSEAAEALGISRASAYECIRIGDLPSIRMGGRILVPRRQLEALLDGGDDGRAA